MNRDLTHGISGGRRASHRQVPAAYSLIDRLRAAHPGVEIESCASGGARADYEILRRTDRIWTSDCNDPIERQRIQRTFSIFFPPEVMGAHVGPADSHTTARTTSLELRALTALFGHFGIEADISRFSDSDRALLVEAVALHKRLRPILHGGRLARLEHEDPGLTAFSVGVDDTVLVSVAQLETPRVSPTAPLPLTALAEGYWTASLLNPRYRPEAVMKSVPGWARGEPITASAVVWRAGGLPVGVLRAGEIALWRLERRV
jgi:alpha-galactosidase